MAEDFICISVRLSESGVSSRPNVEQGFQPFEGNLQSSVLSIPTEGPLTPHLRLQVHRNTLDYAMLAFLLGKWTPRSANRMGRMPMKQSSQPFANRRQPAELCSEHSY